MKPELIKNKLNQLQTMVNDLERNNQVIHRIGGVTHVSLGEEINFQQKRIDNLTWAQTTTDETIQAKIAQLESTVDPAVLLCKYGSVRGLTLEQIQAVAMIEDLEIALGTHPAVKGE